MNHIYDTFLKKTDILSKALDKATDRTRTMLYVVTFFSLLILVSSFNASLAWDRKLNAKERLLSTIELNLIPQMSLKPFNQDLIKDLKRHGLEISQESMDRDTAEKLEYIQVQAQDNDSIKADFEKYCIKLKDSGLLLDHSDYFKIFFERQKFTIPIIGLSCYVDDVYLIGGLGLLILLTYSFFSVRRENRIVQRISKSIEYIESENPRNYLHDHSYSPQEIALIKHNLMEYIFYGCSEFFIFNTGRTKTDITVMDELSGGKKDYTNYSARFIRTATYYLPIFAMLFCLLFEAGSYIQRHNFISESDAKELWVRYFFTVTLMVVIFLQSKWIVDLNKNSAFLIDKMFDKVKESREALKLA